MKHSFCSAKVNLYAPKKSKTDNQEAEGNFLNKVTISCPVSRPELVLTQNQLTEEDDSFPEERSCNMMTLSIYDDNTPNSSPKGTTIIELGNHITGGR